jgi:hypothetical protein
MTGLEILAELETMCDNLEKALELARWKGGTPISSIRAELFTVLAGGRRAIGDALERLKSEADYPQPGAGDAPSVN